MAVLQSSNGLIAYRCKPCPWTGVNDVPGLYKGEGMFFGSEKGGWKGEAANVFTGTS
jgi:hypothetical protein